MAPAKGSDFFQNTVGSGAGPEAGRPPRPNGLGQLSKTKLVGRDEAAAHICPEVWLGEVLPRNK